MVLDQLGDRYVCRNWSPLTKYAAQLHGEEKLFFVLVATHFGDNDLNTSRRFYEIVPWQQLQSCSGLEAFRLLTDEFFQSKPFIGDHRKHIRGMSGPTERLEYTWDLIVHYRDTMNQCGSQAVFFATDGSASFDTLFNRMTKLKFFERRLPRFDHLERLARTHDFYIVPERMYADLPETAGPRDGLTLLTHGWRFRKEGRPFKTYLVTGFPPLWNTFAPQYRIELHATVGAVIRSLDRWAVAEVGRRLAAQNIDKRALVFELESCLCDWQKGK
jgi:hypothetical protein